jgi:hypothetical protein
MNSKQRIGNQHAKNNQNDNSELIIVGFGSRAICDQNFSKVVALPKTALTNLGENIARVNVELVQENGDRYIKISALDNKGGDLHE